MRLPEANRKRSTNPAPVSSPHPQPSLGSPRPGLPALAVFGCGRSGRSRNRAVSSKPLAKTPHNVTGSALWARGGATTRVTIQTTMSVTLPYKPGPVHP